MGIPEETMETESNGVTKKWVIAGIQFLTPLKPIYTKRSIPKPYEVQKEEEEEVQKEEEEEEKECCTTPTTPESRIPTLECPGAPRKRKAVSQIHCNGVPDYFKPPDLESVFLRCVERA